VKRFRRYGLKLTENADKTSDLVF